MYSAAGGLRSPGNVPHIKQAPVLRMNVIIALPPVLLRDLRWDVHYPKTDGYWCPLIESALAFIKNTHRLNF